jgi:flagellar motility protein MotE (MotC chaperone)
MSKGKLAIIIVVPMLLGISYGLAKVQVIPTQKMGRKNPALARILRPLGLYKTPLPVKLAAIAAAPALSPEQQALQAQRDALNKERADWETQKQAQAQAADKAKQAPTVAPFDPRETARMASIYEQMPADTVIKIFAKLPDPQVIALLRRMDEKKVSEVLAAIAPERAAFFTQSLSRAAAPERTASATP